MLGNQSEAWEPKRGTLLKEEMKGELASFALRDNHAKTSIGVNGSAANAYSSTTETVNVYVTKARHQISESGACSLCDFLFRYG